MSGLPFSKKPRTEIVISDDEEEDEEKVTAEEQNWNEQEAALVALVEHRTREVNRLRERIAYYKAQLDEAEKLLDKTETELAHHRVKSARRASESFWNDQKEFKIERSTPPANMRGHCSQNQSHCTPQWLDKDTIVPTRNERSTSPANMSGHCSQSQSYRTPQWFGKDTIVPTGNGPKVEGDSSQSQIHSKPQFVMLSVAPDVKHRIRMKETETEVATGSDALTTASIPTHNNSNENRRRGRACKLETVESQSKATKRKHEHRERKDLISLIGNNSLPQKLHCQTGCLLHSQHKRKLRCLVLSPTNDDLFVTSALDGVVNLWQLHESGSSADLLSTYECQSEKQKRWPEDIVWHPQGNRCFSVYSADGVDSQISILDLNRGKERMSLSFLKDKPHVKGIINSINFMPWDETCFVTGGSDHDVVLWTEQHMEDSWKSKSLHRSSHSSAVMGVAGMRHKKSVMSAGADKRIIGFDMMTERVDSKHQTESKCLSINTNPYDFNLFMVQTATPERQLKLFDFRTMERYTHAFGWKQESSESQSALVNQAWSPDGLYIASGSADPVVHIFDIRYNSHKPLQSIRVHHKRVFKAVWHNRLPLLVSISSDLNIGLHRITF